ncbi:MAG: DUF4382 domain-containing protein [Bacteroidetes bacterium]|nr:DUF4382 domain-containing protein [Bacteroidota bacterium]
MKKMLFIMAMLVAMAVMFASCDKDKNSGTLKLSITDAPIDSDGITGVFITVTEIQYHLNRGENDWQVFEEFEGPKLINLLDLTHGETSLLGNLELEAGTYTQIRFILDAPVYGMGTPSNPGCYLEFEGGAIEPLFVPSGSESGFKGVGAFTVPLNGVVEVTADFDVRKSVVHAGASGMYILKPKIRLVVNEQAGKIVGSVINIPVDSQIAIYAYAQGTYSDDEALDPAAETPRFPNAISSDVVGVSGSYHIDFLAPITYDLIVAKAIGGEFSVVLGIVDGVVVESKDTTTVNINIDEL